MKIKHHLKYILDPIYTGLVTTVQVLYLLEKYVVVAEFS